MSKLNVRPAVLTFSASDSAGFAGMQMDLRVQTALGVHCAQVVTANTAQNNQGVISVNEVNDAVLQEQVLANSQLNFSVIKTGLLLTPQQIESVAQVTQDFRKPLILDPVFKSSSGNQFSALDIAHYIQQHLLPYTSLITPNLEEAQQLTGIQVLNQDDIIKIADALMAKGVQAVLIKGGHSQNDICQDYFSDGHRSFWLSSPRHPTTNTRGTGCALASAIAAAMARGYSLYDAVVIAKMAINQGLRQSYSLLEQKGCLSVEYFPKHQQDMPLLTEKAETALQIEQLSQANDKSSVMPEFRFPPLNLPAGDVQKDGNADDNKDSSEPPSLGLYPVVDRAEWLQRLLPLGINTIQLRVKDLQGQALETEIEQAVALAKKYQARLFINDYWQLAIDKGAYGIHLGQEDLETADLAAIREAGLRLGTSSHCHYEVARALSLRPSYIACGPVYSTTTKDMPWIPHDISGLKYWVDLLQLPVVAIGGIKEQRVDKVAATQVSGIAMITAITLAEDPEATAKKYMQAIAQYESDKGLTTYKPESP